MCRDLSCYASCNGRSNGWNRSIYTILHLYIVNCGCNWILWCCRCWWRSHVCSLIVLSVLNLPVAIVGLLISIEPLIDMARTALNVSGGLTTGVLTARVTKSLDKDIYDDKNSVLDSTEQNVI